MAHGEQLIYSGSICTDDLLGVPDLLRREGSDYIPGDIKSGAGLEGPEGEKRPKEHYGVQLALYVDILERKGLSSARRGFIWDIHSEEVAYDLMAPMGQRTSRTPWDAYQECLRIARGIVGQTEITLPAHAAPCKLCHWRSACLRRLRQDNDLTLIPELGRSRREAMASRIATVKQLSVINPGQFSQGKKTVFPGIGPETLEKFQRRAQLLANPQGKPYLKEAVALPTAEQEIFFDVEFDPFNEVCYLHGFVERLADRSERYVAFFADAPDPAKEEEAFRQAWTYLQRARPRVIYYYSKYERTIWRLLRERYPKVCTEAEIESLFNQAEAIDLYYDIVLPKTEWPTLDYSIKTLAAHLGFTWRDSHPSGAASIEWFHRWIETNDPAVRQRILEYNEDDCLATRVLLDALRLLPVMTPD
jgi:predicted RecB family nuclease